MEDEVAFFNDENALRMLSQFGIGVEHIPGYNAASNTSTNDDDIVGMLWSLLRRESEVSGLEAFAVRIRWPIAQNNYQSVIINEEWGLTC